MTPRALERETWESATWPLGATIVSDTEVTFAVYAPAATRVELELYSEPTGRDAFLSVELARCSDGIWRGMLTQLGEGALYAYRCWGPNWPYDPAWKRGGSSAGYISDVDVHGNRFNPNKALFDPYARELSHDLESTLITDAGGDAGVFGTGHDPYQGMVRREADSGPYVPKGIVVAEEPWPHEKLLLPPEQAAIYEAHVKGLTMHPTSSNLAQLLSGTPGFEEAKDVPAELRGTYAGAALMAPYLKALGMTTIELLPVHQTNSSEGRDVASSNWWGYQTLAYFAPNRSYAYDRSPGGPTREFKHMVQAFHEAGIEVYLDVVFNHTAEGGNWGGQLDTTGFVSMGGFATPSYYALSDQLTLIDGATGCSNQLNFSSDVTQRLTLDSLTYWCDTMGVDGFRFDLAPVLGRTPNAFERSNWSRQRQFFSSHPLLGAIRDFADERGIEVIAEAWDLWGYEVGNFPSGWGEWNGRYRDALRSFCKGDANTQAFCDQFNGDYAHFSDQGGPQHSVDFVTAHDGFTMADLVSYNTKLNDQPYPFGPSDGGSDSNLSWDSGGDQAFRRQRIRNFMTLLFLSRGVPMFVSGDEYGRTQNGNNNPWCLDTIGMWNNWAAAGSNAPQRVPVDPDHPEIVSHDNLGVADTPENLNPLLVFTAYMAWLRQLHPGLHQRTYADAQLEAGDDVTYVFSGTSYETQCGSADRSLSILIDCSEVGEAGDLFVLVNMDDKDVTYTLPPTDPDHPWRLIVDTAEAHEKELNHWPGREGPLVGGTYEATGWSVAVLANPKLER
ncbi:MAG TPA: isoamylase [Propionibacteriaceae bacterium]|nr:isoamylase [Propionibacteriaceae bacterium]